MTIRRKNIVDAVEAVFALREELIVQTTKKAMEQPEVYGDPDAMLDWVDSSLLPVAMEAYAAHVIAQTVDESQPTERSI